MASSSSATLVKLSRLMRLSEMSRKNRSTMFSHDALVGVKCMTRRGCLALVPMPGLAHGDDGAVEGVERGEQRRGAVALVVVGDGAGTAGLHRQAGLRAVERLDLALLVAAEHQGVLGRVQVQPHHIEQLVLEARVARELEGARQVRPDAVALPDTPDGGRTQAQ